MSISTKIIADSISPDGIRLTTFLLRYPRFIHAELMTHRVFSRNASSSRAIPVKKLIADIRRDPAMFRWWGKNQKGMQAEEELTGFALWFVQFLWLAGMWIMTTLALLADKAGAHKQTVNRMVEPWSHISVVVTSTSYANWFALRDHPDAMPEIMWLARYMQEQYLHGRPKRLKPGEWHVPFVTDEEIGILGWEGAIKVSVARCARTSYRTHDNRVATVEEEYGLYDRLIDRSPLHASPAEHQANPDSKQRVLVSAIEDTTFSWEEERWKNPEYHGNFTGWKQYRKFLPNEYVPDVPHEHDWLAID